MALQTALDAAEADGASAVTIKLEQGEYDGNFAHSRLMANVNIRGGYTPSPAHDCSQRQIDATKTVIRSLNTLDSDADSGAAHVLVTIDNVTLKDGGSVMTSDVELSSVVATDWMQVGSWHVPGTPGSLKLTNVVMADGLFVNMDSDHDLLLNHATIHGDLTISDAVESGDKRASIWNSIVWSGGNITLYHPDDQDPGYQFSIGVDLHNVDYQTLHSLPIDDIRFDANRPSIHQDPMWADPGNGDFSLTGGASSPVIDHGSSDPPHGDPPTDIVGNTRRIGSATDMGAYESPYGGSGVFVVTNTNDVVDVNDPLYQGSLRWAMIQANASNSTALLKFALPACPSIIKLNSPLPNVWVPMEIDGYSSPGAQPNTDAGSLFNGRVCVAIQPASSATTPSAFVVPSGAHDVSLAVQGIGFGGFSQGIYLAGGHGHRIIGNEFGGVVNGVQLFGFDTAGVRVEVAAPVIIGGPNPAERNVFRNSNSFSNADAAGVLIGTFASNQQLDCQIIGNLFGISPDGNSADANNENGIVIKGTGCAVLGNYLAGNVKDAIRLIGGSRNVIQYNTIGPRITPGLPFFYNPGAGIRLLGDADDNIIGAGDGFYGPVYSYQNTITQMNGGGVVVNDGTGNTIRGNAIYFNGLAAGMNVDLGGDGPTQNDAGDADGGSNLANDLMNFPVPNGTVFNVAGPPQFGFVAFTVRSALDAQAGEYLIDAYYDTDCGQNGRGGGSWVGSGTYTASGAGPGIAEVPVYVPFFGFDSQNGRISLTATELGSTHQSTSEFSACLSVDTIFSNGFER